MRTFMNTLAISVLIATIILTTFEISLGFYFLVFTILMSLILINFKFDKNRNLYKSVLVVNVSVFLVYCFISYISNGNIISTKIEALFLTVIIVTVLALFYLIIIKGDFQEQIEKSQDTLISKREKDLHSLINYVEHFKVVGLNGEWGTGKTFLIEALKEKIEKEYEFIEIDLLTSNLNEMQETLIKRFEEVLLKNRILPKYSTKIKNNIEATSFFSKIQDFVNLILKDNNSSSEVFQEFQNEVKKLDKKVLIIYEDIDRITNVDVIKEVFSISEKIASDRIRVIYQYDELILNELGLTWEYLEKYIPFKVNLTELHLQEILLFELKNLKQSVLKIQDFDFLRYSSHQENTLIRAFGLNSDYETSVYIDYIPIRKVKHLLQELVMTLEKKGKNYNDHKKIVIAFYIVKHMSWEIYEKLSIQESLLESIKFQKNNMEYTMIQLVEKFDKGEITKKDMEEIFSNEDNRKKYATLKLFQYKIFSKGHRSQEYLEHHNEKVDRVIWSLLYEGKSVFTDIEHAIILFSEKVLSKSSEEYGEAFNEFWQYLYKSDGITTEHTTIFKIGTSHYVELFKAFKIANREKENKIKLIEFYFKHRKPSIIDLEVIQCLNYFSLETAEEYLKIIEYVNELKVEGNLSDNEYFISFMKIYIQALTKLGFFPSYNYLNNNVLEDKHFMMKKLQDLIEDLTSLKRKHKELKLYSTVKDIDIIVKFIEKVLEVLKFDGKYKSSSSPSIRTTVKSRKTNQEEFDRLSELLKLDEKAGMEEINISYTNGKVNLYEVEELAEQLSIKDELKK